MTFPIQASSRRGRALRAAVLAAGLVVPQAILFGPSLVGTRILLPIDLLALQGFYLPDTPRWDWVVPQDHVLADQVLVYEPNRRFVASELRSGRLALWNPYGYAGAPFASFHKYSPFMWLYYLTGSPFSLAWIQLIKSLVAGIGAFLFFRRVARASFWPAATGAWCFPLIGYLVLWQGFSLSYVVAWFPWVLLATDAAVRRPRGLGGPALAVLTSLVLLSGQVDVAGQTLLASGIYAVWRLIDEHRGRVLSRRMLAPVGCAALAWMLGSLVSAPYVLPLVNYARTGARIAARSEGAEERPPVGLGALPQILLPDAYGTTRHGSLFVFGGGNQPESGAAAYAGLLATLLVAPLAFIRRRRRAFLVLWGVLILISLGWVLDLPGIVSVLRLPGLNLMSHNRFVFVAAFAVLALAVEGLEAIREGGPGKRALTLALAIPPLVFGAWCLLRISQPPEPVATRLETAILEGKPHSLVPDMAAILQIQRSFRHAYLRGAVLSLLAVAGWWAVRSRRVPRPALGAALGGLMLGELLVTGYGANPQADPSLYYPSIPVLEELARRNDGRVMSVGCLPPNFNERFGLREVRGYDGVDPLRILDLLSLARDPTAHVTRYARTLWYAPRLTASPTGHVQVSPVLSMLNVRYLVFRGDPPPNVRTLLRSEGYWVAENQDALPRVWVPLRVQSVRDSREALASLRASQFDPRRVAYVVGQVDLPGPSRGAAHIIDETPEQVTVSFEMETSGVVVLADQWYEGWHAYLDGRRVPVLRANHALRAVAVRAGRGTLVFRYEPNDFRLGVWLMALAAAALATWLAVARRNLRLT